MYEQQYTPICIPKYDIAHNKKMTLECGKHLDTLLNHRQNLAVKMRKETYN